MLLNIECNPSRFESPDTKTKGFASYKYATQFSIYISPKSLFRSQTLR